MRALCRATLVVALATAPAVRVPAQIEPEARKLLADCVKAYRNLRAIDMETTYTGDPGGFTKPNRSRLTAQKSNRLLFELWQDTPGFPQPTVMRWLCDGKSLYVYDERQRYYTQEKAPRNFAGIQLSGAGIEFAAMTGSDPFAGIEGQARALRMAGEADVNGEVTDVVLIDTGSEARTGEARFFIARSDLLIRRFTFDSLQIEKPRTGPPPERLNPDDPPEQDLKIPPVRFGYQNKVIMNPRLPATVFAWTKPEGVFHYQPLRELLTQKPTPRRGSTVAGKDTRTGKPLTFGDLVRMAKKQKKIR